MMQALFKKFLLLMLCMNAAMAMADALAAAQPNVEYRVIADANHTMQRLA